MSADGNTSATNFSWYVARSVGSVLAKVYGLWLAVCYLYTGRFFVWQMAIIIDLDASLIFRLRWVKMLEYSERRIAYKKWELNRSFPLVLWLWISRFSRFYGVYGAQPKYSEIHTFCRFWFDSFSMSQAGYLLYDHESPVKHNRISSSCASVYEAFVWLLNKECDPLCCSILQYSDVDQCFGGIFCLLLHGYT